MNWSRAFGHTGKRCAMALVAALFALAFAFSAPGQAWAQAGSASDGTRTLTVSKAQGLSETGETVTVSGSGYDTEKGIYIAYCVVQQGGGVPSPCGGGIDLTGSAGAAIWISSNPPSYGQGLAIPYGAGGSFSVNVRLSPQLNPSTDCRVARCAVITRNDHTRGGDRSQDLVVPVSFGSVQPPPATPTPVPAQPTATATASPRPGTPATAVPPTPTGEAPAAPSPSATATSTPGPAVVSQDGLRVTAGGKTLTATKVSGLAEGEQVTVGGSGFAEARGIYVALCREPALAETPPGPCAGGSRDTSAWISSNPPSYARDLVQPYATGGSFAVQLKLSPVIDGTTDCRVVRCAISTRADDTEPGDRSQDLMLPVSFATGASPEQPSPEPTPQAALPGADATGGDGSGSTWLWLAGGAAVIAAAGLALFAVRYRRRLNPIATMLSLLAALLLLASCGANSTTAGEKEPIVVGQAPAELALPVTVMSADGREVTITDVSRIVPLWGNISEVVFGLGLGANVVGRDVSATFSEAAALPTVTRGHDVSVEGVLSLRPTLVLASADNTGPAAALSQIRSAGVPVLVVKDPASIEEVAPRIRAIATALGVPANGDRLVAKLEQDLDRVKAEIPKGGDPLRVAFLYMRGQAGVYLIAGPGSGADSMIAAAGAVDAGTAMGLSNPFTPITSEALVKAAPDVILMTTSGMQSVGGMDGVLEIPGIKQTPAGKERRIVVVEDGLLYSFGPRTPIALEQLIALLYATPEHQG